MNRWLRFAYFTTILFTFPFSRILEFGTLPSWKLCLAPHPPFLTSVLTAETEILPWLSADLSTFTLWPILLLTAGSILASAFDYKSKVFDWLSLTLISYLLLYWSRFCFTTHELAPLPVSLLLWNLSNRDLPPSTAIRFQQIHFSLIFFAAGVSKMLNGGSEWTHAHSLQNILVLQNYLFEGAWIFEQQVQLNQWLAKQQSLCQALSFLVLAVELGAPLALIRSRFGLHYLGVIGPALMQITIFLVVYINFVTWIPLYLFWIPPETWRRIDGTVERFSKDHIQGLRC